MCVLKFMDKINGIIIVIKSIRQIKQKLGQYPIIVYVQHYIIDYNKDDNGQIRINFNTSSREEPLNPVTNASFYNLYLYSSVMFKCLKEGI